MKKIIFIILGLISCLMISGCQETPPETPPETPTKKDKTINITTNNVNKYFRSHVEVYESGYGFQYELTITPKTIVKNVDLYIEVYTYVNYTYTFINIYQPIYYGEQEVVLADRLSSTGYGYASTYKGTGTNIIACSIYVEVVYTSGTIDV